MAIPRFSRFALWSGVAAGFVLGVTTWIIVSNGRPAPAQSGGLIQPGTGLKPPLDVAPNGIQPGRGQVVTNPSGLGGPNGIPPGGQLPQDSAALLGASALSVPPANTAFDEITIYLSGKAEGIENKLVLRDVTYKGAQQGGRDMFFVFQSKGNPRGLWLINSAQVIAARFRGVTTKKNSGAE